MSAWSGIPAYYSNTATSLLEMGGGKIQTEKCNTVTPTMSFVPVVILQCMVKLYSVGGRSMNEYGELLEWYWQEKTKYFEKNLTQCHVVHHKSHTDWPEVQPGPLWWQTGDKLHQLWHCQEALRSSWIRDTVLAATQLCQHLYTCLKYFWKPMYAASWSTVTKLTWISALCLQVLPFIGLFICRLRLQSHGVKLKQ